VEVVAEITLRVQVQELELVVREVQQILVLVMVLAVVEETLVEILVVQVVLE
jgi:hypothetical protein